MHFIYSIALCALPLISSVPLDLIGGVGKTTISGVGNSFGETLNQPAGAVVPVLQILKNPENIVQNVNAALGNILPAKIDSKQQYDATLRDIRNEVKEIGELSITFAGLFQAVTKVSAPSSIPDALKQLEHTIGNGTNGVTLENVGLTLLNGLSVTDLTQNVLSGYLSDINSYNNSNPAARERIYPQKAPADAPYTVSEDNLRSALYIPKTFTYGQKRPILFIPGTGAFGGVNFISNLGKLLSANPAYDPVYLNVPGAMYNDVQINAEYIVYATNYLSAITNRQDIAQIAWSQGNLANQWSFQYWPSTRLVVTDFISISADFHGTTLAYFLDPAFPNVVPNPPSIIQQEYDSHFVRTLRNAGGHAPYVPSTSIWSITDEIVQPQYAPFASAAYFTQDLPSSGSSQDSSICPYDASNSSSSSSSSSPNQHNAGAGSVQPPSQGAAIPFTNTQLQSICPKLPAGGFYPHEGVLYNPLTYALVLDALAHEGPGRVDRLDLASICEQVVAPGLSLDDVLATEGLIPLAALNLLLYPGKVLDEPAVRGYAAGNGNGGCA